MPESSSSDYRQAVDELMLAAAVDFRNSASDASEYRLAICRYLRRGSAVGFSQAELIDFLGISTPSVLDMAGYSDETAQRVMDLLADVTDEELRSVQL